MSTAADPTAFASVLARFEALARKTPGEPLLTFVDDEGRDAETLTYANLDGRAERLASHLVHEEGSRPGDRVLLAHPPSLEFVVALLACFKASLIAVPAMVPDPMNPAKGLVTFHAIARDCGARLALTTTTYQRAKWLGGLRGALTFRRADWPDLKWLASDKRFGRPGPLPSPRADGPSDVAFLQYTSGSTSAPRGVMITHGNLAHQLSTNAEDLGALPGERVVFWVPQYHDFGLIGALCNMLFHGMRTYMMSPLTFIARPWVWFDVMSRVSASYTAAPNFAFEHAVRKTTPEQRRRWDLGSLKGVVCAAEPIRPETMEAFFGAFAAAKFPPSAFAPSYGLAEHTVGVTMCGRSTVRFAREPLEKGGRAVALADGAGERPALTYVGCGGPSRGVEVRIVDPATSQPLEEGRIGEIWVDSPSKAAGYFGKPEESERVFQARTAGAGDPRTYLRTGDLGFFHGGELFITGRLKDLIITRGRNVYPQDVEETVRRAHPEIRPGGVVAFAVPADGSTGDGLAVLVEMRQEKASPDARAEVLAAVRRAVALDHQEICAAILIGQPGAVLKTTSGKVRRQACRQAFLDREPRFMDRVVEVVRAEEGPAVALPEGPLAGSGQDGVEGEILSTLVGLVAAQVERPREAIAVDEPLDQLGLDSLKRVELCLQVEAATGARVDPGALAEHPTLRSLAEHLAYRAEGSDDAIASSAEEDALRAHGLSLASEVQRALWLDCRAFGDAHATSFAMRVTGPLTDEQITGSVAALLRRHALLRASFAEHEGRLCFRVLEDVLPAVRFVDAAGFTDADVRAQLCASAAEPFDTEKPPLARLTVMRIGVEERVLHFLVHHLAYDAVAVLRLVSELVQALAEGPAALAELTPLPPYEDFARWERSCLRGARGERLWKHWEKELSGSCLDLPLHQRAPLTARRMEGVPVRLSPELTAAVMECAARLGTTINTVLSAAWFGSLAAELGADDLALGTSVSLRYHRAFAEVSGPAVNYVVLRAPLAEAGSFAALVGQVHRSLRSGLAHGELPIGRLLEKLRPAGGPPRATFGLNANFNFYDVDALVGDPALASLRRGQAVQRGDLRIQNVVAGDLPMVRPYELMLNVFLAEGMLGGALRYHPELIDEAQAHRMLDGWRAILTQGTSDEQAPWRAARSTESA
jgi:acyl-CoA synthetase (AMP-forming)/AMP-acid ligase II/acyl carrier protein